MERIPDHIKVLVKGLPGVRLNYGVKDSEIISCGGLHPLEEHIPITILQAEISRPEGKEGYVILAEKTQGANEEYNLVVKDPDGVHWTFATPGFEELTGLEPDVVCERRGEFRRSLLEKIFTAAYAESLPHHRGINVIQTVSPTLAGLPFSEIA